MKIFVGPPELHVTLQKLLPLRNCRKSSACGVGGLTLAATDEVQSERQSYEHECFHFLQIVQAQAQIGRGGASIAGKTPNLHDAPQTRPPYLLSCCVLFCSWILGVTLFTWLILLPPCLHYAHHPHQFSIRQYFSFRCFALCFYAKCEQ